MIRRIRHLIADRLDESGFTFDIAGTHKAYFRGIGAAGVNEQKLLGARFAEGALQRAVFFVVDQLIFQWICPQCVFENTIADQGGRIRAYIQNGFIVIVPYHLPFGTSDFIGQQFTAVHVFESDGVKSASHGINNDIYQLMIGTYFGVHIKKRLAFAQLIAVGDYFFRCIQRTFLAAIHRIFKAFFVARIIEVVVQRIRH